MTMLLLAFLCGMPPLFADQAPLPGAEPAPPQVELCELFRNPERWNGKMIRVRGPLLPGVGEDGPWLSGEGCKERIRTKNITWPNHIFLEAPENKQPRVHPINFHLDNAAADEMNRLWQEVKWKSEAPEYVEGTVIGVFETRSPIGRLVPEGWGNGYAGFGHLNRNPAQLVMKTIQEMRIEPGPPPTQH